MKITECANEAGLQNQQVLEFKNICYLAWPDAY